MLHTQGHKLQSIALLSEPKYLYILQLKRKLSTKHNVKNYVFFYIYEIIINMV